jgi:hypothetical protein
VAPVCVLISLVAQSAAADPVNYAFSWTGDGSYSLRGIFGYDAATAPPIIVEISAGPTNTLTHLSVSFFDPSNTPLQSFNTVSGGVSNSPFFRFNFDTTTEQLFADFNVGGGTNADGVQFFLGTIGGLLQLREIDTGGPDIVLDSQRVGTIIVTPAAAPEPSGLALSGMALAAIVASYRARRRDRRKTSEFASARAANASRAHP